ncbi:YidB family protein [Deefgea piscis]|uniref:YidB family protein n=1 Tax=Deefgea piscis TaxID=2739061 RepID=UPI001C80F7BA|nr:YidB family protein [Deefgea piscis]QZA81912.1 YidB family protein [Deefgea piscis]
MGLLDSLAGQFLGGSNSEGTMGMLSTLLEQQGGVAGVVEKFQNGGLGEIAQSWVASGQNLPISSEQIEAVLGNETVAGIADKLGIDPATAAGQISSLLPQLIDSLTPNGQIEAGNTDVMGAAMNLIKGKLFG